MESNAFREMVRGNFSAALQSIQKREIDQHEVLFYNHLILLMRGYYAEVLDQALVDLKYLTDKLERKLDLVTKLGQLTDLYKNNYYQEVVQIIKEAETIIDEDRKHKITYYHTYLMRIILGIAYYNLGKYYHSSYHLGQIDEENIASYSTGILALYYLYRLLVAIEIEQAEDEKSTTIRDNYLNLLDKLQKETQDEQITRIFMYAQAIIDRDQFAFIPQARAQGIFRKIIQESQEFSLRIQATINLSHMLLLEYKTFRNKDVRLEIMQLIESLETLGEHQKVRNLHMEALIIKAKLVFYDDNLIESADLLEQAKQYAEKYKYSKALEEIGMIQNSIIQQVEKWDRFMKINESYIKKLEMSHFIEFLEESLQTN